MIHIVMLIFFAIATGMLAKAKNRNVIKWGMMGFFFGLSGLIALGFVPQKIKMEKELI